MCSEIVEKECVKDQYRIRRRKFDRYCAITWQWREMECNLVLLTNRKWYTQHCAAISATAEPLFLMTRQQALLWRRIGVKLGSMDWRTCECVHRDRRANVLNNIRLLNSAGTVAAPAQWSQVISRSETPQARSSGVRDVARIFFLGCTFFLKKVDDLF